MQLQAKEQPLQRLCGRSMCSLPEEAAGGLGVLVGGQRWPRQLLRAL